MEVIENPKTHPFEKELEELINKYSIENRSDTPDYILAEYMFTCLLAYQNAVKARDKWFSVDMWSENKRSLEFNEKPETDMFKEMEQAGSKIPEMCKTLEANGWRTYKHHDNWIKNEWYYNIGVENMGLDLHAAYTQCISDLKFKK